MGDIFGQGGVINLHRFPKAGHNDIEEKFRKVFLSKLEKFIEMIGDFYASCYESALATVQIPFPE